MEPSFVVAPSIPSHRVQPQQQQQKAGKIPIAKATSGTSATKSSFPPLTSPPFSAPQQSLSSLQPKDGLSAPFNINNVTINMSSDGQNGTAGSPSKQGGNGILAFLQPELAFSSSSGGEVKPSLQSSQPPPQQGKRAQASASQKVKSITSLGSASKKPGDPASMTSANGGALNGAAGGSDQKTANGATPPFPAQAFVPYSGPAYLFGNAPFDMTRFPGFHPGMMSMYSQMKPGSSFPPGAQNFFF
jgi:hypothetical protein